MKLPLRAACSLLFLLAGFAASCSGADFTASLNGSGGAGAGGAFGGSAGRTSGSAGSMAATAGGEGRPVGGSNAGGSAQGGAAGDGELAGAAGEPVSVAGSGALGGGGATAQGGGGNATSGGGAGAGGTAGMSSTGASGSAGAAGTGGCSSVPWFPDGDGDGFGRSSGEVMACAPPSNGAWVKQGGDCNDDNAAVFPMNPDFYGQGYTTSGNTLSFDYDCSGTEEIDPGAKGAAPQCNGLSCSGSGFQATSRSGSGVNDLCGSTKLVTCTGSLLNCSASVTDVDGAPCH